MIKYFYSVLITYLLLANLGCQNNNSTKEKELELKERELALREKELKEKENKGDESTATLPIQNTQNSYQVPPKVTVAKYVYVVFKVQEPKLHHTDAKHEYGLDGISSSYTIPELNYVTYDDYIYTSEIKEVPGYDENKQYEYMDRMEAGVREKLTYINMNFDGEVFMNVRDREEREKLKDYQAKITDRKMKVFSSYKEASIHRNNNKGKF